MDNRTDVRKLGQGIVGMLRLFWGITLLLLLAGQAWGQAVWDGTTSEPGKDGNGSYLITTAEELAWVAEQVNSGKDNFSGKTIRLESDILLNMTEGWVNWDENTTGLNAWIPIGSFDLPFKGFFDGQRHVVKGIYISGDSKKEIGLFGAISGDGAAVWNVGVVESFISGGERVGGIVGYVFSFTRNSISGCYNSGKVMGNNEVGGIVGVNGYVVGNCYNEGEVIGNHKVGGIAGFNNGNKSVFNCYNTGKVTGGEPLGAVGGIVGENANDAVISNCYNIGQITGDGNVGAIAGIVVSGGSVHDCYYLDSSCGEAPVAGTFPKSLDAFKSGEVADKLYMGFGQALGEGGDPYPVLLFFLNTEEKASKEVYCVIFSYGENQSIVKYGNNGAKIDMEVSVIPDKEGYTKGWDTQLPYTIDMTGMEIKAEYTPIPYKIEILPATGGTFEVVTNGQAVADGDEIAFGSEVSLTAEPMVGNKLKAWIVTTFDGKEVTVTDDLFTMPAGGVTVTAEFVKISDEDPTGIESVEGLEMYAHNGVLFVRTPSRGRVTVIALTGRLVWSGMQIGMREYTGLASGAYLVRVGERVFKVWIR